MKHILSTFTALAVLSACAVAEDPTVTERDIERAFAEASRIQNLPLTDTSDLPTGTVTYDGQIGAAIDGDIDGSILADMTMNVGFSANRVNGTVSNINLIDEDGNPDQLLGGTLEISGFENGGTVDALALGDVTGVDNGSEFETEMSIFLDGDVRDDLIEGDAISGDADGSANGDVDFSIQGVFFGTER